MFRNPGRQKGQSSLVHTVFHSLYVKSENRFIVFMTIYPLRKSEHSNMRSIQSFSTLNQFKNKFEKSHALQPICFKIKLLDIV